MSYKNVDWSVSRDQAANDDLVCEMFGNDCVYHPRKGALPNRFQMLMQRWLLGFRWIPRSEWEARPYNTGFQIGKPSGSPRK